MIETGKGKMGGGCLVVFGAIFFVAGLIPGYFAVSSLWQWFEARDWIEVPAQITAVELESHRGSEGGTTWSVSASYSYQYQGVSYTGDRVGFSGTADNIGSFHQDTYQRLDRHRREGSPASAWLDPDRPDRAVLVRDMRWGLFALMMLFPLLFSGVGALVIAGAIWAGRKVKKESQREQRQPESPWLWKDEWKDGVIPCGSNAMMWVAVGFATVWNLISAPLLFVLPGEILEKGNHLAAVGFLFPLVGIGLAAWAVHSVIRWRKYGRSTLVLRNNPVPVGGRLEAELRCPTPVASDVLQLRLDCVRKQVTGSGKNRRTRESIEWQDEGTARVSAGSRHSGLRAPVSMTIPPNARPTDESNPSDSLFWRLTATAEVPGVDYHAEFRLPVFQTSDQPVSDEPLAFRSRGDREDSPGDWRKAGLEYSFVSEGERFYAPPARKPLGGAIMTLVGIGFGVGAWFAIRAEAWFVTLVVGLFTLVFGAAGLFGLLYRSEIIVRRGRLKHRGGLGWMGDFKELPADEIKRIGIDKEGQTGHTVHYRIRAERWAGTPVTLAHWIKGRRTAQALADALAEKAGVEPSG